MPGFTVQQYIIDKELVHQSVKVCVRFVHILVNLELTVNHPDRWLEREWRIGCDEAWVQRWDKRHCVDEGEDGWLKNHACPSVLRVAQMRDLFQHINDVSTEHPKTEKVWSWSQSWRAS